MDNLRHVQLSVMECDIIHSIWYETERRAPYHMFMNPRPGTNSLTNNRVTTHASEDDTRLHTWLVHTLTFLDIFNYHCCIAFCPTHVTFFDALNQISNQFYIFRGEILKRPDT